MYIYYYIYYTIYICFIRIPTFTLSPYSKKKQLIN